MDNYIKEIGKSLRKWRQLKGITQEQLAFEAGVTPQTISSYECGSATPSLSTLIKMIKSLKISLSQLFSFDDESLTIDDIELQYLLVEKFKNVPYNKRQVIFNIIDVILAEKN